MGSRVTSFLYDAFKHWYRGEGGNVWFYGDPHFGDLDLYIGRLNLVPTEYVGGSTEKYYMDINDPKKVYSETMLKQMLQDFDEMQVKNINSAVGKNGTIVILGDVGDISYIPKIKGYKILIRGNHDAGVEKYRRKKDVRSTFDSSTISPDDERRLDLARRTGDFILASMVSYAITKNYTEEEVVSDNKLFDEVYKGCLMISDKLILSHVPVDFEYAFNIHGHLHSKFYHGDEKHFNTCAEAIDYKPISLTAIIRDLNLIANIKDVNQDATNQATARKLGLLDEK